MTTELDDPWAERPMVGIAAFDFDRTLTRRDTLIPFLGRLAGRRRLALAVAAQARRYRQDQDAAKLDMLRRLTTGILGDEFDLAGRDYAVGLHHLLRPDMMARLRWHRSEGHRLVIVSASLGTYLRPFGVTLGVDEVLAVELDVAPSGLLTGQVTGGVNTRGPEKARRLTSWLAETVPTDATPRIWAYGDSSGDDELLAMADHPVRVTRELITGPPHEMPTHRQS
ncbi:MAG TPA: HAD-IB family hydrolase [Acidimicrobiales bacterium]|nr:HAD-IB family hydrolase [Acidimicrobiales bacterium]